MKVIVVDGLYETRSQYEKLIKEYDPFADVKHSVSAEDAVCIALEFEPDIIFTSERLSFRNAYKLSELLNNSAFNVPVVVIANDGNNAIEAIKNDVFELLIAPIDIVSVADILKKLETEHCCENKNVSEVLAPNSMLKVFVNNGYRLVDVENVVYCMADGAYAKVYIADGTSYMVSYSLGKLEIAFAGLGFIRLNRSVIVRQECLYKIDLKKEICLIELNNSIATLHLSKSSVRKLEKENLI